MARASGRTALVTDAARGKARKAAEVLCELDCPMEERQATGHTTRVCHLAGSGSISGSLR